MKVPYRTVAHYLPRSFFQATVLTNEYILRYLLMGIFRLNSDNFAMFYKRRNIIFLSNPYDRDAKRSYKANFLKASPTQLKNWHNISKISPWPNQAKIFISADSTWFTESFEVFASFFIFLEKNLLFEIQLWYIHSTVLICEHVYQPVMI